jgi:hypothetical protein
MRKWSTVKLTEIVTRVCDLNAAAGVVYRLDDADIEGY